jgi:tetratricopeptide (TPR) repeat protein
MKRLAIAAVLVGIVALVAGYARAQDLPWKPADPNAPPGENPQPAGAPGEVPPAGAPAADKPAVDLEKALTPELYQRAIKPILYQIERANKVLGLYNKEMAKPEKGRNEKRATGYRENAARFYLAASQKAQQARKMVPEDENQNAVTTQYEIPLRNKVLEIYSNLAAERMAKKDLRGATRYYQQILKIDPENALAQKELKGIAAIVKANAEAGQRSRRASSGSKDDEEDEEDYDEKYNHDPKDYEDRGGKHY